MNSILFSSEWEKYYATIDEQLSQIKVDLKAKDFQDDYQHSFFIRLYIDFEGNYPTQDEEVKITTILDYLEAGFISKQKDVKFVGSISNHSMLDFIFVANEVFNLNDILNAAIKDIRFESSWLEDDKWNLYNNLIYPSEEDLIYIYNRNLLGQYYNENEKRKHDIYQYLVFKKKHDAQAFLSEVYEEYEVLDAILTKDEMYIVQLVKEEDMTFIDLNESSLQLYNLAKKHEGHYVSCHFKNLHKEVVN